MSVPSLPPNVQGEIQGTLRVEVTSSPLPGETVQVHFWGLPYAVDLPAEFAVRSDPPHFFSYLSDMGELKFTFSSGASCSVGLMPFLRTAKDFHLRICGKFPLVNRHNIDAGKVQVSVVIRNWVKSSASLSPSRLPPRSAAPSRDAGDLQTRSSADRMTESIRQKVIQTLDRSNAITAKIATGAMVSNSPVRRPHSSVVAEQPAAAPAPAPAPAPTPAPAQAPDFGPGPRAVPTSPSHALVRMDPPTPRELPCRAFALVDLQDPLFDFNGVSGSTRNSPETNSSAKPKQPLSVGKRAGPPSVPGGRWMLRSTSSLRFTPTGESVILSKQPHGVGRQSAALLSLRIESGEISSPGYTDHVFSSILSKYAELAAPVNLVFGRVPAAFSFALLLNNRPFATAQLKLPQDSALAGKQSLILEFLKAGGAAAAPGAILARLDLALTHEMRVFVNIQPVSDQPFPAEYDIHARFTGVAVAEATRGRLASSCTYEVKLRSKDFVAGANRVHLLLEVWKDKGHTKVFGIGKLNLNLADLGQTDVVECRSLTDPGKLYKFRVILSETDHAWAAPHVPETIELQKTVHELIELDTLTIERSSISVMPEIATDLFPDPMVFATVHTTVLDDDLVNLAALNGTRDRISPSPVPEVEFMTPARTPPVPVSVSPHPLLSTPLQAQLSATFSPSESGPSPAPSETLSPPIEETAFSRAVAERLASFEEHLAYLEGSEIQDLYRRNMRQLDHLFDGEGDEGEQEEDTSEADQDNEEEEASADSEDSRELEDSGELMRRIRQHLTELPFALRLEDRSSVAVSVQAEQEVEQVQLERLEDGIKSPVEIVEAKKLAPIVADIMVEGDESKSEAILPVAQVAVVQLAGPVVLKELGIVRGAVLAVEEEKSRGVFITEEDVDASDILQDDKEWKKEEEREAQAVVVRKPVWLPSYEERQLLRRHFLLKDKKRVSKILIGESSSSEE